MKKIATLVTLLIAATFSLPSFAGGEEKKVCETKVDPKTKKDKEVCKTIKVHKKVEGDKVPDGKKK
jgi:hypothetical protein